MSHVDQGMLHAYLDGALGEYPSSEARRVRDHLDACGACRERLAAERRIRDEAATILDLAAPRVDVPTLEELRAYARADTARRAPVDGRLRWLGWAASLVLALGTGWMLHGGERATPAAPVAPPTRQEAAAPVGGSPDRASAVEIAQAAPAATRPAAPEIVAIAIDTPSVDVTGDEALEETLAAADLVPPALPEPEAIAVAALDERRVAPEATPSPDELRDPTSTARRAAPGEVVTSASASAPQTGLSLGRGAADARGDTAPSTDDSYSLVVPGPLVLDVRFRGSGTRPEGQVARQLLESGDTLQVIHLPPDLDPASLEPRAEGTNELVVKRSAGWIIMRAPLDDARLMELMTRLLAGS